MNSDLGSTGLCWTILLLLPDQIPVETTLFHKAFVSSQLNWESFEFKFFLNCKFQKSYLGDCSTRDDSNDIGVLDCTQSMGNYKDCPTSSNII